MTTTNNIQIHESGSYTYDFSEKSGTFDFHISWWKEVAIYCFVYNADVTANITVQSSDTRANVSAIVVSSKGIKSTLNITGYVNVSHSIVDIYALSLLGNNAKATVNGGVVIAPDVQKGEWYLSEENILLWKNITIKSLPMLDVRSNDVKASHGAKIDRLDAQKVFYLTAKWLSKSDAEHLMVQSYIQKALDHANVTDPENIIEHIFSIL